MRDRLGMLCAVGAVACLGSLTIHWSQPYPVQRSDWEQQLFSDLVDSPEVPKPLTAATSEPAAAAVRLMQPIATDDAGPTAGAHGRRPVPLPLTSLSATPIDQRPHAERPRFILPVKHEAAPADASRSNSGAPVPSPPSKDAAEKPVTLYFSPIDDD